VFAPKTRLIATSAVGVLALTVATQTAAQAPASQTHSAHAGASVKVLDRPSARFERSIAVARYDRAYRQAGAAGVAPSRDLASVPEMSTPALRRAADRLSNDAHRASAGVSSPASTTGFASPESFGVSQATLDSIAACESGGNPAAVSPDGTYRGKYQFDYGTWASVGGSGDPAAAPVAEQDMRAAMLYSQAGSSPWPICG